MFDIRHIMHIFILCLITIVVQSGQTQILANKRDFNENQD